MSPKDAIQILKSMFDNEQPEPEKITEAINTLDKFVNKKDEEYVKAFYEDLVELYKKHDKVYIFTGDFLKGVRKKYGIKNK